MATIPELLEQLKNNSARAGVRGPGSTGAMTARGRVPSTPAPLVPQQLRDALMNKAARGEPLSDNERAILEKAGRQQQAGLIPPYEPGPSRREAATQEPEPVAAPADAPQGRVPDGAVAIVQQNKKFFLVDAGGTPLEELKRLRNGAYSLPNGTKIQADAAGTGFEVIPGDLTTTSSAGADNLAASDIALGPRSGLTPKKKKGPSKIDKLADAIRQATTRSSEEALANTKTIISRIDALQPEEMDALLSHPSLAEGIESVAAKRDPAAREAAIGRARERVEALRNARSTTDRAAEQLDQARQARDAARAPATANPAAPTARAAFAEARDVARSLLPAGDFNAAAAAYNSLSPEARSALLASSRDGTAKAILDAADLFVSRQNPDLDGDALMAARTKLQRELQAGAALPDELVQSIAAPTNDLDALFANLDGAMKAGDTEAADALRGQIQAAAQADPEAARRAQRTYLGRRALADGLGRAMQADLIAPEAAALRAAESAPPPRPAIAPGARQPEVQPFDRQPNELPLDADNARALTNEARDARANRAPLGGIPLESTDEVAGRKELIGDDLPIFFRGRDRNPPLDARSRGERAVDTRDAASVEKALKLDEEVKQAQQAVDAATETAARVAAMARLKKAYAAIDKAFPPRLVNDKTGKVIERVTRGQRNGTEPLPKGYRLETGRKAYTDSSVNRAGSQETMEDLVYGVTGFRRRGRRAISTTNADGMGGSELDGALADARLEFGDDVDEFVDDIDGDPTFRDEVSEAIDARGPAKQQQRGGQPAQSRIADSLVRGFGNVNPLTIPGLETPEAVAVEVLSRVRGLKPGTATYDMMVDRFAKAVKDKYGAGRTNPAAVLEARDAAPVTSRTPPQEAVAQPVDAPEDVARQAAEAYAVGWTAAKKAGASDDEAVAAGNAARKRWAQERKAAEGGDLPPVAGDLATPAAGDLPPPAGGAAPAPKTPEDSKLDASATDLGPVAGDLPPPKTRDEIQKEADEVFKNELAAAKADGLKGRAAADRANAARKAHVDAETAKAKAGKTALPPVSGSVGATPAPTPAAAGAATPTPTPAPASPAAAGPAAGPLPPPAGNVGATPSPAGGTPAGGAAAGAAPAGGGKGGKGGGKGGKGGKGKGATPPASTLQKIRDAAWKWGVRAGVTAGVLYGGGRLLDGLSRSDGGEHVPPPGAGGGGAGNAPPAGFPPVPPGGQGGAADAQSEAEAQINAALESLSRGENLNARVPQYQTFQNYNQWN